MTAHLEKMTIQAYKYGGRLHYEWETRLLEETDAYILVLGEYGRKLQHYTKGQVFEVPNWTLEYFSYTDGYTVSGDLKNGEIYQYYCNICQPARRDGNVVSFVDLDLDYVMRDGRWSVVDEDEFASHTISLGYPPEVVDQARRELERLQRRTREKLHPFDGTLARWGSIVQESGARRDE